MKEFAKRIFYFVFRLFSIVKTSFFSRLLISSGYLLQSEGLYNHSKVRAFKDRKEMHGYLASQYISPDEKIHFMEFGVFWGQTFRIWVEGNKIPKPNLPVSTPSPDLPEDWGSEKKGSFSAAGKLPDIHDPRIEWQVGLIQDTLPLYIKKISKDETKGNPYRCRSIQCFPDHPYLPAALSPAWRHHHLRRLLHFHQNHA